MDSCLEGATNHIKRSWDPTVGKGVKDAIESWNGNAANDAEVIQLLIVHSDGTCNVSFSDDHEWGGPGRLGVFNDTSSKTGVNNRVNLSTYCRVGPKRAGCDGFSTRGHMKFKGGQLCTKLSRFWRW